MDRKKIIRIVCSAFGVFVLGIGAGLLRVSELGTDPYSCMNLGISGILNKCGIGITYGVWQIVMNAIILGWMLLWKRKLVGIGMVFNIIFVGLVSDVTYNVSNIFMSDYMEIWLRVLIMIIGVVVLCFGIAFYIEADTGTAPYDEVGYAISDKLNNKLSFRVCRIITDFICVSIGVVTYIQVDSIFKILGIGTVIMAFGTGPLVQFFRDNITSKIVK